MTDADCTPGREPRSVAASLLFFVSKKILRTGMRLLCANKYCLLRYLNTKDSKVTDGHKGFLYVSETNLHINSIQDKKTNNVSAYECELQTRVQLKINS